MKFRGTTQSRKRRLHLQTSLETRLANHAIELEATGNTFVRDLGIAQKLRNLRPNAVIVWHKFGNGWAFAQPGTPGEPQSLSLSLSTPPALLAVFVYLSAEQQERDARDAKESQVQLMCNPDNAREDDAICYG